MKLLGFELTLRARRLPPPLPSRLVVQLVRLRDVPGRFRYSVAPGTVGVVEDTDEDRQQHFVSWASGGSSGPIDDVDLERIGELSLPLEDQR